MENYSGELLFAFGVNHKTAPLHVREKLYLKESETAELLAIYKQSAAECVILSTCNRTEIYGVARAGEFDLEHYKNILLKFKNAETDVSSADFFAFVSCAACRQLFSVATGVDSKIVGDTQILNQLRTAYETARTAKTTGSVLNQLSQRAFKIGKKVYHETNLNKGAVSVSLAAVGMAREILGSLEDRTVMIVGAGETAQLTAECLLARRIGKILIANRTTARAETLLNHLRSKFDFAGEVVPFDEFKKRLPETDLLISSTDASAPILTKDDFRNLHKDILLFDIAVPRDIAPDAADAPFVTLKNIDDLQMIIDRNFERRMKDLPAVKKIIGHEMSDFLQWYYLQQIMPERPKTGRKTARDEAAGFLRTKDFLRANLAEIHRLARSGGENYAADLENHFSLVAKLRTSVQTLLGEKNV